MTVKTFFDVSFFLLEYFTFIHSILLNITISICLWSRVAMKSISRHKHQHISNIVMRTRSCWTLFNYHIYWNDSYNGKSSLVVWHVEYPELNLNFENEYNIPINIRKCLALLVSLKAQVKCSWCVVIVNNNLIAHYYVCSMNLVCRSKHHFIEHNFWCSVHNLYEFTALPWFLWSHLIW